MRLHQRGWDLLQAAWTDEAKLALWTRIELLAIQAQTGGALLQVEVPTPAEVAARELVTDHDVAAFVDVLATKIGFRRGHRLLHHGLTSSDVTDTALAATLVASCGFLLALPLPYRHRGMLVAARTGVAVGKVSGATGTYSSIPPEVEAYVLPRLGLRAEPSTQVVVRDRIAELVFVLALIGQTNRFIGPALESVALWGERDLTHSSVERLNLLPAFEAAYRRAAWDT